MSSKSWRMRPDKGYVNLPDVIGGVPHPEYLEQLMGYPPGWTESEP
jgi:hypothetical protein